MFAQVRIFAEMQHKQNNALRICSTEQSSLQAHLALQQKCNTWRTMHCAFAVAQRIRFCASMHTCRNVIIRVCASAHCPMAVAFGCSARRHVLAHAMYYCVFGTHRRTCYLFPVSVCFVVQSSNSFCCTSCFQSSIVRVGSVFVFSSPQVNFCSCLMHLM